MERIDALATLERITRHWDIRLSTSQHDHWMDVLCQLADTQAGTTFARLMRQSTAPTPAQFLAAADAHRPTSNRWCEACANTGLVTDTRHPEHWPDDASRPQLASDPNECICNIATPCSCEHGKVTRAWMTRLEPAERFTK